MEGVGDPRRAGRLGRGGTWRGPTRAARRPAAGGWVWLVCETIVPWHGESTRAARPITKAAMRCSPQYGHGRGGACEAEEHKEDALNGLRRAHDHNLPFVHVVIVDQARRETFNRVLVQFYRRGKVMVVGGCWWWRGVGGRGMDRCKRGRSKSTMHAPVQARLFLPRRSIHPERHRPPLSVWRGRPYGICKGVA